MSLSAEKGGGDWTRPQEDSLVELVLSGLDLTVAGLAARINARFPNRPKLRAIDVVQELGRRGIALPGAVPPRSEGVPVPYRPPLSPEARQRWEEDTARRAASASQALMVIDNTVFVPANRLDLEWGAEALRYWSDPELGPEGVSELLRPRKAGLASWGFYVKIDGQPRVISAWWVWVTEQIDIIDLCKRARHYFHRCHLTDDELATSWQKRIMFEVRTNGWDAEQLRAVMPLRASGSQWPVATVRNVLNDPACSMSSALRHAVDRGLIVLRNGGKKVAA